MCAHVDICIASYIPTSRYVCAHGYKESHVHELRAKMEL